MQHVEDQGDRAFVRCRWLGRAESGSGASGAPRTRIDRHGRNSCTTSVTCHGILAKSLSPINGPTERETEPEVLLLHITRR